MVDDDEASPEGVSNLRGPLAIGLFWGGARGFFVHDEAEMVSRQPSGATILSAKFGELIAIIATGPPCHGTQTAQPECQLIRPSIGLALEERRDSLEFAAQSQR
jgi:hypothetical protein